MEEQLISFETAKLAKEKGLLKCEEYFYTEEDGLCSIDGDGEFLNIFNSNLEQIDYRYDCNGDFWYDEENDEFYEPEKYLAITQSLLQKWLRENYQLHITIYSASQESWMYRITRPHQELHEGLYDEDFENYEECLEHALQEALKLI